MGLTRIRAQQISDIDYKQAVRVITLTNITLTGGAPVEVDGVSLQAGNRILVNGQDDAAQNGLYVVQTAGTGSDGTWVRTADANQDGEILPGMVVMVTEGTVYADTPWKLVTNGEIIIGTTELVFEENYSLAFGNVYANGTAVIANTVSAAITFEAGDNISIIGNNTTKSVTIGVTGISLNSIANGTSNVTVVSSGGNVTVGIADSEVAEFSTTGLDVAGNITSGNIATVGLVDTIDLSISGTVTGNLTPSANITYDLGNTTNRWNDIWLANSTIYLGNSQISANNSSLILTNPDGGTTVLSGSPTSISADSISVGGNISGGNLIALAQGQVLFNDSDDSNYVGFRASDTVASNIVWTLPATDGTPGQVLATNGSGILTWTTGGGGGGLTWTTQANTAPVIANPGDFWYDSASQIKYQYIDDGTSNVWVDQSAPTTFASISVGQVINTNANGIGNIGSAGTYFGNLFVSAVNADTISAAGNITGDYILGNGSQLTGIDATSIQSGTSNVRVLSSNGNVSVGVDGNAILRFTTSGIVNDMGNGVGNIGNATGYFNTIFAKATSAQYADLAERYSADQDYEPGTVVIFGGSQEITQSTQSHDPRVAGIISTDPAFVMNDGSTGLLVALTGRVPCRVQGPISKGDLLVTGDRPGTAQRLGSWTPGCVIGKSLEDLDRDDLAMIEVAVGRF